MGHTPKHLHMDPKFRRVHDLRTRLGLQRENSDTMYAVPQHPGLDADCSLAEFIELDKNAVETGNEYKERVQCSNKIVRATCETCP